MAVDSGPILKMESHDLLGVGRRLEEQEVRGTRFGVEKPLSDKAKTAAGAGWQSDVLAGGAIRPSWGEMGKGPSNIQVGSSEPRAQLEINLGNPPSTRICNDELAVPEEVSINKWTKPKDGVGWGGAPMSRGWEIWGGPDEFWPRL